MLTLSGERNKMCSRLFTKSFDMVVDVFFLILLYITTSIEATTVHDNIMIHLNFDIIFIVALSIETPLPT